MNFITLHETARECCTPGSLKMESDVTWRLHRVNRPANHLIAGDVTFVETGFFGLRENYSDWESDLPYHGEHCILPNPGR